MNTLGITEKKIRFALKIKKRNWDARKRKKRGRVQSLRNKDEIL